MKDLGIGSNPFFIIFRKKNPQKFGSFENNAYFLRTCYHSSRISGHKNILVN